MGNDTMWVVLSLLVALLLIYLAVQHFRWPLFRAAINAQRGKAGLVEKRITVDGHDIVYLDGGSGEPLMLLHGFGANKDNWIQIAPLLAPHYRLIIPDLPGFGDSTRDFDRRYAADDQLDRLHQFIGELGIGPVHLGGNSMGGFLAGLFGARYPDAVRSLWLLAPAGVEAAEPSEYFLALERGENPLLVDTPADFDRLVSLCFTKTPYVPKAFQRCLCERNISERAFNEKVFADIFSNPIALEQAMASCNVKTQILWGDNDRILHPSGAGVLDKVLANVDTHVMQRMGHCPMLERPDDAATLFLDFQGVG